MTASTKGRQTPHWTPESLGEALAKLDVGPVSIREPMADHTTIKVGGPADAFVVIRDLDALSRTLRYLHQAKIPWLLVGNGSNLIVRDGGIAGAVLHPRGIDALDLSRVAEGRIRAEAGVPLTKIVRIGLEHAFDRIWLLAGIPGSVGGAVWMNAGTKYGEIQEVIESVEVMSPSGNIRVIEREALTFSYRKLHLPRNRLIVAVNLRFETGHAEKIREKHREVMTYRSMTQPLTFPTVGSVFRNPPPGKDGTPVYAGSLIEACGLKGVRVRGAQISSKHANWIVNVGNAKAADILTLIRLMRDRVKREHGVKLELEAKVVGRNPEKMPTGVDEDSLPDEEIQTASTERKEDAQ